jgi:spermidine/putrescine transport system permease protein
MNRRVTFWFLYIPPLVWLGAFFLIPLLLMFAYSFRPDMRGNFFGAWQPTLDQYVKLASAGSYWRLLGISAIIACIISAIAVVLSYPVACFLAFYGKERTAFYLILLLVPFWTSYLLRVMSWKIMLGTEGVIN